MLGGDNSLGGVMEVSEFKRILELGLGRAIRFLQTHDATTPYRDIILDACLHDTRYDSIVEARRSWYLFDAITLTGFQEFYREPILQALKNTSDPNATPTNQLVGLATRFAEQGDQEAHQLVYDQYIAHISSNNCNGFLRSHDLIFLDGIEGFLFASEWFGRRLPEASKYSSPYFFPKDKEEWDEEDHAYWDAAIQRAVDNPHLAAYVEFEQQRLENRAPVKAKWRRKPLFSLSYNQLKHAIVASDRESGFETWGERANEADLERAATDLLRVSEVDIGQFSEEDIVRQQTTLRRYLRIFRKRTFPLDPQKLIELASQAREQPAYDENEFPTPHSWIVIEALNALANINHPAVRELAFELIEERRWMWRNTVLLLISDWQNGDWSILETLTRESFNPFEYHGLGMDIQDIFEVHPTPDAAQTLINLYEYGPCSECRQHYVEALDSIQAVPDWMREECRYDANLDLREWAEGDG